MRRARGMIKSHVFLCIVARNISTARLVLIFDVLNEVHERLSLMVTCASLHETRVMFILQLSRFLPLFFNFSSTINEALTRHHRIALHRATGNHSTGVLLDLAL